MMINTEYIVLQGALREDINTFINRMERGKIALFPQLKEWLNNEIPEVLGLLKLDSDKFYNLVLFCYDYSTDVCLNKLDLIDGGHEMMWKLIYYGRDLLNGNERSKLDADVACTFRIQGKNYKVKEIESIAILLYWIHRGMINMTPKDPIWELNWLIDDYQKHEREAGLSISAVIWCFASLMLDFFKRNPQFKGRAPRGSSISTNKRLLISQIIFHLQLSKNENFLYTDETLKGFLCQYKNKPLPQRGKIYGRYNKGE